MNGALETVVISIDGQPFAPWSAISISVSAEDAARTASIQAHLPDGTAPPWPGRKATVTANGALLLTGYVRDFRPSQGEEDWSADLTLVSRTVDAVEASIEHPTGLAENKDIGGIAKEFDTGGIGIVAEGSFEKHERHQITPGESLVDTLSGLAAAEGAVITDTPEGKLRIVKKPDLAHAGGLAAGVNIITASADFSEAEKFDPVIARGQQSRGHGAAALRGEAVARDASVGRHRPKIAFVETEVTAGRLKKRAEWLSRRGAGDSIGATVEVSGWRDAAGAIWTPNRLVYVRHPRIFLDQMMVIKSVTLTQDTTDGGPGTRASLTLADPRALGGSAGQSKSGSGWAAPEPKAEYRTR